MLLHETIKHSHHKNFIMFIRKKKPEKRCIFSVLPLIGKIRMSIYLDIIRWGEIYFSSNEGKLPMPEFEQIIMKKKVIMIRFKRNYFCLNFYFVKINVNSAEHWDLCLYRRLGMLMLYIWMKEKNNENSILYKLETKKNMFINNDY